MNTKSLFKTAGLLAFCMAFNTVGAEETAPVVDNPPAPAPVKEEPVTETTTETSVTTTTTESTAEAPAPAKKEEKQSIVARIESDLKSDPLYQNVKLDMDVYRGLVVVHGAAPNQEMADVLNGKLRRLKGVTAVYNYMTTPENPTPLHAQSVAFDSFGRLDEVGVGNNSFLLGARVSQRLQADPELSQFDIDVDTYMGLVIMHGNVGEGRLADRAKQIAAHTDGVEGVLSFIMSDRVARGTFIATETPIETSYTPAAPVEVRPYAAEPIEVTEPISVSVDPLGVGGCCR